eukprot:gnl/Dysnectes_brevis/4908_a6816_596.p1 GENE.gnl/Dysnectes_brevis/4908_a6816_596~~gnl/Dysnectes_brevis/4908_a6816_596.p1  ORF type:complete len:265 (+),score=29.84 gnl/Dysnectes_brevis/4908_a6816_596:63-857(+)
MESVQNTFANVNRKRLNFVLLFIFFLAIVSLYLSASELEGFSLFYYSISELGLKSINPEGVKFFSIACLLLTLTSLPIYGIFQRSQRAHIELMSPSVRVSLITYVVGLFLIVQYPINRDIGRLWAFETPNIGPHTVGAALAFGGIGLLTFVWGRILAHRHTQAKNNLRAALCRLSAYLPLPLLVAELICQAVVQRAYSNTCDFSLLQSCSIPALLRWPTQEWTLLTITTLAVVCCCAASSGKRERVNRMLPVRPVSMAIFGLQI